MIKVIVKDKIIKISGHAKFDDYGKDIVCASVSSIVYTTINTLLKIDDKCIKYSDDKDLTIEIIDKSKITYEIIQSMIDILKELEKQYPKNIIVKEN